jgi:FKBP-type peptidyl-prolyl cis-trans isomerase SlyD
MAKVEKNKAVFITYTLTEENGAVLERNDLPVGYIHGADSGLLDKVEKELEGHVAGDRLKITVRPEDGVGDPDPNLVFVDVIKNVPPEYRHVGAEAQFNNDEGEVKTFVVTDISDGKITLDGNHPFAGKTMVFDVTITEVRDATPDEISSGSLEDMTQTVH